MLAFAAVLGLPAVSPLSAGGSDFWNKKDPKDWSSDEIEKLTTKSPWAKEVSAELVMSMGERGSGGGMGRYPDDGDMRGPGTQPPQNRTGGIGMGIPGIGIGIPGMGGGGMGGRRPGGMGGGRGGAGRGPGAEKLKGTVRWESAQPILDAVKSSLPEAFANHYVISVSGFPLNPGRRNRDTEDSGPAPSSDAQDALDHLKAVTYLQPKGKAAAQPGVVQKAVSTGDVILFGFSKEILDLSRDDEEVGFSTRLGRLSIKTKFNLKEMTYHGKLAV
jgi:hypothetical protein